MAATDEVGIGRIVHYVLVDGQHRPGIVVRVLEQGHVHLQVFQDEAEFPVVHRTNVAPDASCTVPGSWHWPERTGGDVHV